MKRSMSYLSSPIHQTLFSEFGFKSFREGQKRIIEAAISFKDTGVFLATGAGKSLCYQLPAFHTCKTTVVVSPLISLMQDQVMRLNNTVGEGKDNVAAFLGPTQKDPSVRQNALKGMYRVVYVSPEHLLFSRLLDELEALIARKGVALFAIDEAHCICEWGADFRREYAKLGELRQRYPQVPIMALTATASRRDREHIVKELGMSSPTLFEGSLDRPNLALSVTSKSGYTALKLLRPLVQALSSKPESTIVYVPTRNGCESIYTSLINALCDKNVVVNIYHAGMKDQERHDVHVGFLSGKVHVVVATIAFGMGIDKPDIRRIIHFGSPKTFESFYQQIGRAGRDGLPSSCELIFSDNDLNQYSSDFYIGNLTETGKQAALSSLNSLQVYAHNIKDCRRHQIVKYFGEKPSFPECGVCDNCVNHENFAGDLERDFTLQTQIILKVIGAFDSRFAVSGVLCIIAGTWKPAKKGVFVADGILDVMEEVQVMKTKLARKCGTKVFFQQMMNPLMQKGYVKGVRKVVRSGKFDHIYQALSLSRAGAKLLKRINSGVVKKVMLPVPGTVRDFEQDLQVKSINLQNKMKKFGIESSLIPQTELDDGEGPVMSAVQNWLDSQVKLRALGRTQIADSRDLLLQRIQNWRIEVAQSLNLSPTHVMAEHFPYVLAYTKPTDMKAMQELGVRIAGVEQLCDLISNWCSEFGIKVAFQSRYDGSDPLLCVPPGDVEAEGRSAPVANIKRNRPYAWQVSAQRFNNNEHIHVIAARQQMKKPILAKTVVGHLLKALSSGVKINLARIIEEGDVTVPTKSEWLKMSEAETKANVNVCAMGNDINTHTSEMMTIIMPKDEYITPFTLKSTEQKNQEHQWRNRFLVYTAMKMTNSPIIFEDNVAGKANSDDESLSKRPRTNI